MGRFRAFVDAWPSSKPKPGDGSHPRIPNSGWQASWDVGLPDTQESLLERFGCNYATLNAPDPFAHLKDRTWTDSPSDKERMPMSWDGGRLPTEAEHMFVRSAGAEQRTFPWGNGPASNANAILIDTPNGSQIDVGTRPSGRSKWGHSDIVGSRWELLLDRSLTVDPANLDFIVPCVDCVDTVHDDLFSRRSTGYGFYLDTSIERGLAGQQQSGEKEPDPTEGSYEWLGLRCARDGD
ncbi:hypothetical protein BH09MYX1_BH09MYX1_32260 [soil metagenome]